MLIRSPGTNELGKSPPLCWADFRSRVQGVHEDWDEALPSGPGASPRDSAGDEAVSFRSVALLGETLFALGGLLDAGRGHEVGSCGATAPSIR